MRTPRTAPDSAPPAADSLEDSAQKFAVAVLLHTAVPSSQTW